MQFGAHLVAAAAAGSVLYQRDARRILLTALGGVIIDIDHFVLYAARSGDWSIFGALRYDRFRHSPIRPGDTRPRYGSLRSTLHEPRFIFPLLALVAWAWPDLRPLAAGIVVHLALDLHLPHYDWRAWARAAGRCEACHVPGLELEVYYRISPRRGGARFALENRVVWCTACAREAYRKRED